MLKLLLNGNSGLLLILTLGPDLQNILGQSYDHLKIMPKVKIDLHRTSNLRNILQ